jgi:two-component system, cell cycle response regulator
MSKAESGSPDTGGDDRPTLERPVFPRPKVLVVDDEPMNLELLERSLHRKYEVITATGGEPALALLRETGNEVSIIISDYRMPGMNGTQFLAESIKYHPEAKRVIITGFADVDAIIDAINLGQVHYFVRKPWSPQELDEMLTGLTRVHYLEKKNRALLDELKKTGLEMKDRLTGLYNHRTFHERLREEIARARRYQKPLSLIFSDLDYFKAINDRDGHTLGDEVLRRVAELLRGEGTDRARESDIIARYGGEEFVLLLPETPKGGARTKAERLCASMRSASFPGGRRLTMSFGVSPACPARPMAAPIP